MEKESIFFLVIGVSAFLGAFFSWLITHEIMDRKLNKMQKKLNEAKYIPGTGKIGYYDSILLEEKSSILRHALTEYNHPYTFARILSCKQIGREGERQNFRYTIEYWNH